MAIPKGLDPTGVILVDKPEGPSSFAIVDRVRRRTGAKTGHAGTLDPFATGLLLLLSGRATKLAQRFSGLDKRYVTEIDLRCRTATGDREGDALGEHDPLAGPELDDALAALTGEIELPIPAASAVKIGGERAYRLHRRGQTVEMPLRTSQVYALERIDAAPGWVTLDLRVSAGTYVRSIADALGGHCRTLRRMEIGPFSVDEADELRVMPVADALAPAPMRIAHAPLQLERQPRAVAIGVFDGVHIGHQRVVATVVGSGLAPTVITFDPHPRAALGNQVELVTTLERRLELLAEAGAEASLVAAFTPELMQVEAEAFAETYLRAIGAEVVAAGEDFRFGARRRGDLELLEKLGFDVIAVPDVPTVSSSAIRAALHDGDVRRAAEMLGRPYELDGVVVAGDQRGGTLGYPTANLALGPGLVCPAFGIYAGSAIGHRAAISIGTNLHYGGRERRIEPYLLDFEGDLYGSRLVVEVWERLRDEAAFASEADLVAQIALDVDATRQAVRPA